ARRLGLDVSGRDSFGAQRPMENAHRCGGTAASTALHVARRKQERQSACGERLRATSPRLGARRSRELQRLLRQVLLRALDPRGAREDNHYARMCKPMWINVGF